MRLHLVTIGIWIKLEVAVFAVTLRTGQERPLTQRRGYKEAATY